MEPDAFAAMQAGARAAKASASAQAGIDGILQRARFYEAALIFKIATRRTAEPAPPRTLTYASGDGSVAE